MNEFVAARPIEQIVDTLRYPLDDRSGPDTLELVTRCREALAEHGSFSLVDFIKPDALHECVSQIQPLIPDHAYRHTQTHNVYFTDADPPLPNNHGALRRLISANHTLCCDQLSGTLIRSIYEWDGLLAFVAAVLERQELYRMRDPLARLNVMGYGADDALNWHFDRAQFTVTLLLQAPVAGGVFRYRRALRTESNPNYAGVARLLSEQDQQVQSLDLEAGTLNVFAGRYAAHCLTPVEGARMRLVAVFSYVESPDVEFSPEDRIRFYGRAE